MGTWEEQGEGRWLILPIAYAPRQGIVSIERLSLFRPRSSKWVIPGRVIPRRR